MQKRQPLAIPLPLDQLHQAPHRLLRAPRPVLRSIIRAQITHRKPRIVQRDPDPQRAVLDELTRRDHVQRRLTRPVRHDADPVHETRGGMCLFFLQELGGELVSDGAVCLGWGEC